MNAFKFSCPACGQRILTEASEIGRATACPSCKATIAIPPPTSEPEAPSPAHPPAPGKDAGATGVTAAPKAEAVSSAPALSPPPALNPPVAPGASQSLALEPDVAESESTSAFAPPPPPQIAVLTPEIKLEIIQAAREHLTDETHWMPAVGGGSGFAYAGKMAGDKIVELAATSPEATHFSLFGAVLRELDRRNVMPIATGRKEFLDQDIPDAIQQVVDRDHVDEPAGQSAPPSLTHPQTLAALDVLAKRFKEEAAKAKSALLVRKLSNLRVEDLVSKLEVEAPLKAEEVATALYHELEELKERLTRVEKALRKSRTSNSSGAGRPR